ncbi:MAG: hypothetical protein WD025_06345 [Bacteriovoracaceae bacterium]
MKNWVLLNLIFILFAGCNFEEGADSAAGTLFAGHKEVTDSFTVNAPASGTYVEAGEIVFKLSHPYVLTVTGTPDFTIDIGGVNALASYVSGSGSKNLYFKYIVQANDEDADGISLVSTSINLNGATIDFDNGTAIQAANLDIGPPDLSGVKVDAKAPELSTITGVAGDYYVDEKVAFLANFSEKVYVTGSPLIATDLGDAVYVSGSGTTDLMFQYTVTSADNGGITADSVELNGGSLKDAAGNSVADLASYAYSGAGVSIDGDTPYVKNFIPPADATYIPGDTIEFALQFTETVDVTGTPIVMIDIGGNPREATYASGSGTDTLVFNYSVTPGNEDDNGVDVGNVIDPNGGTIADTGGKSVDFNMAMDTPRTPGALVDAPLPTVTSISLPSVPGDGYFNEGEEIYFTLNFNDEITVTGFPQLEMELNSLSPAITAVDYNSSSGASSLVMRYVVQSGDEDHDGLSLVSPLNLNGGTIKNNNGTNANLDISDAIALIDTSLHKVDALIPIIQSVDYPDDQTYAIGDNIDFVLSFLENVACSNTARLELNIGGSTVYANCIVAAPSTELTFRYTVVNDDLDTDGIQLISNSVEYTGAGDILDLGGNSADPTLPAPIPSLAGVVVDGVRPDITNVTVAAKPGPAPNTYTEGETITATVTFDDNVYIGGAPKVGATFDEAPSAPEFIYQAGDTTTALTFEYNVQAGDEDLNGIVLDNLISLAGGSIQDNNGNNANLDLSATNFGSVYVDSLVPEVALTNPADSSIISLANSSTTFSITGSCNDADASYDIQINGVSAPGQANIDCDGTNLTGTIDTTGVAFPQDNQPFRVAATDLSGNSTNSAENTVFIDTVRPTMTIAILDKNYQYRLGDEMTFTAAFNETVNVAAGTRIQFDTEEGTLYATFAGGDASDTLTYSYTVQDSDYDSDGIIIGSPLQSNGGSITDDVGNEADYTFVVPGTTGVVLNNGAPSFEWYELAFEGPGAIITKDFGANTTDPGDNTSFEFTIKNVG